MYGRPNVWSSGLSSCFSNRALIRHFTDLSLSFVSALLSCSLLEYIVFCVCTYIHLHSGTQTTTFPPPTYLFTRLCCHTDCP